MNRLAFLTTAILLAGAHQVCADDNYGNTNTSTQEITNTYDNSGQDHSVVDSSQTTDNSQSTDNSTDNSTGDFRNNDINVGSNNQTSTQTITNSKTVGGDLIDSGGGAINQGTNAGGGNITSGSNSNSQANTSSISGSQSGAVSGSQSGALSGSQSGSVSGANSNQSVTVTQPKQSVGVSIAGSTTTYNQVRQAPMAWSPNMAMSMSQENCNNSASLGVSGPIGAIGGGVPIKDDDCTRRRDAILWANFGQMRVACERMTQNEDNLAALKASGVDCAAITAPVVPPQPATSTQREFVPTVVERYYDSLGREDAGKMEAMFKESQYK